MATVSKALILAAGLGTRMLPATKAVPKEMLPIVDRPLIQYAVEEAVAAGIGHVIFVIAEGKEAIREHFGSNTRADAHVAEKGDSELLEIVRRPAGLARFDWAFQDQPKGIAHAVACARQYLEGEPFALIFPDDLILSHRSCVAQMVDAYNETRGSVIAVHEVPREDIPQYGIVDPADGGNPARLRGVVEKPRIEDAPSQLGIVGRYILSETIFEHIDRIPPGKNGELQITDALMSQIAAGEVVSGLRYEGQRYDTGRPLGYLVAQVAAAMARPDMARPARERLAAVLGEGI
ncbi:MAG: UTP--glucose-1-phosphate uridylyltransferase [Dehalococcoidia bacterium]|nr:UTP--glucose-1-phosphate uridylyltransferase [Dehalococcoidia bacterium]